MGLTAPPGKVIRQQYTKEPVGKASHGAFEMPRKYKTSGRWDAIPLGIDGSSVPSIPSILFSRKYQGGIDGIDRKNWIYRINGVEVELTP